MPMSTTIAPSRTKPPVIRPGTPAATISRSAIRVCSASRPASAVCLCAEITVALRASPRIAAGFPTLVERPTTTRSRPSKASLRVAADVGHVAVEHVESGGGGGRGEPRRAEREQARVLRVLGLDVLEPRERAQDVGLRQVRRQRAQDEDPGHALVAVELVDRTASTRGSEASAGSRSGPREDPGLACAAVDPALVDLRRVVVPDQQRGDPDRAVERPDAVDDLLHQLAPRRPARR